MLIRGFEPRLVGLNLLIKATMAPKLFCGRQFTDSASFLLKEIKLNRLLKMLIVWSNLSADSSDKLHENIPLTMVTKNIKAMTK